MAEYRGITGGIEQRTSGQGQLVGCNTHAIAIVLADDGIAKEQRLCGYTQDNGKGGERLLPHRG